MCPAPRRRLRSLTPGSGRLPIEYGRGGLRSCRPKTSRLPRHIPWFSFRHIYVGFRRVDVTGEPNCKRGGSRSRKGTPDGANRLLRHQEKHVLHQEKHGKAHWTPTRKDGGTTGDVRPHPRSLPSLRRTGTSHAKLHRLEKRHKALAELKSATVARCEYCIDVGSQISRQWDLSDGQLLALPNYKTSNFFDEVDKLVLD